MLYTDKQLVIRLPNKKWYNVIGKIDRYIYF